MVRNRLKFRITSSSIKTHERLDIRVSVHESQVLRYSAGIGG